MPELERGIQVEKTYGRRARLSLLDFLDFAEQAAELVSRGRAAYDQDAQLRLAGEAIVHRLGEAVARLPDSLLKAHPVIPFRAAKRMRFLIASHGRADPEIIWATLSNNLPAMAAQVKQLLEGTDSSHRG